MERLKRGLVFWVLLLVSIALPAAGQTTVKKAVYLGKIKIGVTGVGNSVMSATASGYDTDVNTHAYPNRSVTKVALRIDGDSREILLCDSSSAEPCTYAADGNLDLTAVVNGPRLSLAGVTGLEFRTALNAGTMLIELNSGGLGAGFYVRIF